MNEIELYRERIKRNILKSFQVDLEKSDFDEFEKSRSGIYQDNAENRRLNRVGQKYRTSGKQEGESSLNDHAREASTEALNKVLQSKNASKEMKVAAEEELKNREVKKFQKQ